MIRLQKYLAQCGIASRRQSETLISAGRVQVNGRVAQLGESVDPERDAVTLDGRPVATDSHVYILLNKPRGVVTSLKDTHRRGTVIDCLKGVETRVFPVGRLDLDVEGALLLTNDGELAFRLTHPSYEVNKVYLAWVEGLMQPETAARLAKGVELEDGWTAPAQVSIQRTQQNRTLIELIIHEGRKREVKRMCALVGHPVLDLRRVAIDRVHLGDLQPGQWRYLTAAELQALRRRVGLG